jgi:hypothetical protein
MTLDQEVTQLSSELQSESVVQRRAAVRHAAHLLAEPRCTAAQAATIVELLRDLIASETYTTVRDDAQNVLANVWQGVDATVRADDRPFMIGVRCKYGHVSYYDRRRVCSGESVLMRERVRDGAHAAERFYVSCRTAGCGERVTLQIDCGEYGQ